MRATEDFARSSATSGSEADASVAVHGSPSLAGLLNLTQLPWSTLATVRSTSPIGFYRYGFHDLQMNVLILISMNINNSCTRPKDRQ